jgi:hypothetical protein
MAVAAAVTACATWLSAGCSLAAAPVRAAQSQVTDVPCGKALGPLQPAAGTTLALKRACSYQGTLTITAANVTVTAYGTGSNPVITLKQDGATISLSGSGTTVENLSLAGVAPGTWNCHGKKTPAGHVDGIDIAAGSLGNTITNISATGFYAGVYVNAGSTGNVIEDSTFTNNTELDTNSSSGSSGAFGILLWGSSNTISGNTISGSQACSIAYGYDGSAVEVYGGSHNLINDNQASSDNTFTELGSYPGSIATGNSYQGNTVTDGTSHGNSFLVTRGSGDPDGPVSGTVVTGNTVSLTSAGDQGLISYAWQPGEGTLLTVTGNYLDLGANQVLYEDGGYVDGGGNTYLGTCNPATACPSGPPLVR